MRRWLVVLGSVVLVALLAACGSERSKDVTVGDELLAVTFDEAGAWEEGEFPANGDEIASTLTVAGGQYRIDHRSTRSASFTWGGSSSDYDDVVVDVQTEQISSENDNLYGVGCRLVTDDDGDTSGYVLLISGDGHYGIARVDNNNLDFVLDWHQSDVIKQGREANTLRAVCVGDYLALYVNDKFMGEVTDTRFVRPGRVGLVAGVTEGNTVSVLFDDLTIYEGAVEDK